MAMGNALMSLTVVKSCCTFGIGLSRVVICVFKIDEFAAFVMSIIDELSEIYRSVFFQNLVEQRHY